MKKTIFIAALIIFAATAYAQGLKDVSFPIKELGNCGSERACKAYCDQPANIDQCIAFGKAHGLISDEEAAQGEKFSAAMKSGSGPGGCTSKDSCENYCSDTSHIDECLKFAKDHGLMQGNDLAEAEKVKDLLDKGEKLPGDCKNKTACEAYCKNPEHAQECLAFAKDNGLIDQKESDDAEKFLPLLESGNTPGGCKTKDECENYCENQSHFDECLAFAQKAGLISGNELEIAKKTHGEGPGGCRGEECQVFCEEPQNQATCFNFAKDNGLVSGEDLQKMEEDANKLKDQLNSAPADVKSCLDSILGPEGQRALDSGEFFGVGRDAGEEIQKCFENTFEKQKQDMEKQGEEMKKQGEELNKQFENMRKGGDRGESQGTSSEEMDNARQEAEQKAKEIENQYQQQYQQNQEHYQQEYQNSSSTAPTSPPSAPAPSYGY